jgi:2-keto-4-pentenoate hydratase/2-oxohepta-3-ene-1,7-dioic acid hydratase in catechol pathway
VKIVVYGPLERVGILDAGRVLDLNAADPELPADLLSLIQRGDAGIARATAVLEASRGAAVDGKRVFNASDVELHAPWARKRVACAGGNYAAHSYGMAVNRGTKDVTVEKMAAQMRAAGNWGFWKVLDEVAGPGDDVPYPSQAEYFDYEAEVAIVIGKRGKDILASELEDYVWGVTLANDWSNREAGAGPARAMSFNTQKNFDRSLSLGPCIVVGELDAQNVDVELRVNGDLRQKYNSADMVFNFAEILAYLSRDFTFVPGDLILGGTGAGTAQDSTKLNADGSRPKDRFLKKGDLVQISSPAIGTLESRVV